ncbi:hypothetical protein [Streptomyces sp. NPDC058084]|uniref:hypothetical protein n=1 Tax=Streptomyces sp. NPDC058084 TaxID=3346333 RepID=UPI0036EADBB5
MRAGYRTAPAARGRRIASRTLASAAAWGSGAPDSPFAGRGRELVHAPGDEASCRASCRAALVRVFRAERTLAAHSTTSPRPMHLWSPRDAG